jgi:hypothetical protein
MDVALSGMTLTGFAGSRGSHKAALSARLEPCRGFITFPIYAIKKPSLCWVSCLAVREGFEPSIRCRIHTFQACSFNRSDTSPCSKFRSRGKARTLKHAWPKLKEFRLTKMHNCMNFKDIGNTVVTPVPQNPSTTNSRNGVRSSASGIPPQTHAPDGHRTWRTGFRYACRRHLVPA